jgi:hypothetical protein
MNIPPAPFPLVYPLECRENHTCIINTHCEFCGVCIDRENIFSYFKCCDCHLKFDNNIFKICKPDSKEQD